MDKEEALEIISMIADGLDPYGEDDPSKNLPEIKRWGLFLGQWLPRVLNDSNRGSQLCMIL